MNGQGTLTQAPARKLRWIMAAHALWLAFVGMQSAWWASLVYKQAQTITELEQRLGSPALEGSRTQRMLHWEAGAFFLIMLAGSVFLLWLYWRDALRSRSTQAFFASFTHELRTPLTSIRLQAETIAESLPADGPDAKLVGRLLEDTSRLESQVDRTLELARVEGGGQVQVESVALKPAVERAFSRWREMYRDRVELSAEISSDLAIRADVAAFQVVLRNLIENAIRHARRPSVRVSISTDTSRAGWVGLRVVDDGVGFTGAPGELGRLFGKGASSTGTGVGLYLVRILMQRMGGEAEFKSTSAGFQVTLWFLAEPVLRGEHVA